MSEETEVQITPEIYQEIVGSGKSQTERVLRKCMVQLVKSGHAAFLFLADDESRNWWEKTLTAAKISVDRRKEQWRLYEIKNQAWERLSVTDRKVLNLRKPITPKGPNPNV